VVRSPSAKTREAAVELIRNPPWLVELFEAALAESDATRRKMFGSACAFVGGNLCCGLFGTSMFVRLSGPDRARLLALPGAEPFDPMGGRPMREYALIPPSILEDEPALQHWIGRALDFAAGLPPKPKKTQKQQTKKKSANARAAPPNANKGVSPRKRR
jgi:TfoX/Sxy family transcriptional regulator of competence genes